MSVAVGGQGALGAVRADGDPRRGRATRAEVLALLTFVLGFVVVAKFVHPARPALVFLTALGVFLFARRSFHLGVALYALSFPFVGLLPVRLFGIVALNIMNLMHLALGLSLLVGSLRRAGEKEEFTGRAVFMLLGACYAWLLFGVLLGVGTGVPFMEALDGWRDFLSATLPLVFGAAVAAQGRRARAVAAGAILVAVVLMSLWALIGHGMEVASGGDAARLREGGRLGQPNNFGAFLALAMPGFVAVAGAGGRLWLRLAGWLALVLCLMSLFNTISRGSILAGCAGLVVAGLLSRPRVLVGLAVLGLAIVLIAAPQHVVDRFEKTFQGGDETEGLGKTAHLRREFYRFTPTAFADSPLVGSGLHSFARVAARHGRPELARSPHSWYIQVLVETGLVGFALFGLLTAVTLRALWRRRTARVDDPLDRGLASAVLASTVAFAVVCFFQKPFTDNEMILPFYFIGLGLAVGPPFRGRVGPAGGRRPGRRKD